MHLKKSSGEVYFCGVVRFLSFQTWKRAEKFMRLVIRILYLTDFTKTYLYKIQDSFQLCSSKASANQ